MAAMSDSAVVLGADIEGLAAAVVLAQSGKKVHVVDACDRAGGFAQRLELHPGHSVPGLLHDTALARRKLLESLGLARHGLAWRADESQLCITSDLAETLVIGRTAPIGTVPSGSRAPEPRRPWVREWREKRWTPGPFSEWR